MLNLCVVQQWTIILPAEDPEQEENDHNYSHRTTWLRVQAHQCVHEEHTSIATNAFNTEKRP